MQGSCKIPAKSIQKSCKKHPRSKQDSGKNLQQSVKNYPGIMQVLSNNQVSCSINLRIMQDVMRCVKIAFFHSPKRFQKVIARCVQNVHSVYVFLKIETILFTIHFQFQKWLSTFSKALRKASFTWDRDRKTEKERTIYYTSELTWVLFSTFLFMNI